MGEMVSVVMPTYNCASFIQEAVESVVAQTYPSWELIIVDDCSTDNTKAVLAPYLAKYPNIHYTCLEKNSGPAVARSEALKQAKGDYVAFLDSDDLWTPNKLSLQIDFMKQKNVPFSATGYELIGDDGTSKGVALIPPQKTNYDKMLRLSCPVGNLTVMYDRRVIGDQQVPAIKKRNDFALWLQTLHKTDACYGMPDVLGKYRVRSQSISRNKLKLLPYHWHLYHDIEKLGIVKTAWYIFCWGFVKGTKIGINKVQLEDLHKRDIEDSTLYYE